MGGLIFHNKTRQILCLTQTPGLLHETLGQGQVVDLFSQIGVAEPIDLCFLFRPKMSLTRDIVKINGIRCRWTHCSKNQTKVTLKPTAYGYKSVIRSRVFPKIDDSGNVGNKGLCREDQNKFSKKGNLQWGLDLGPYTSLMAYLVLHSHAFLTKLP